MPIKNAEIKALTIFAFLEVSMDIKERDADWVSAYLEWADNGGAEIRESEPVEWIVPYEAEMAWGDIDRQHALLEGILQRALRTETECIHIARRALAVEDASLRIEEARAALSYAEKLLQDENQAWGLVHSDFTRRWPHPLQNIDADVRMLSLRVFELRPF